MPMRCGHRGCTAEVRDVWWTAPNLVTAIRSAGNGG